MRTTLLFALFATATGYRVAIAGANGALGRELVHQSLEKRWSVCAYTRMPTCALFRPTRSGFFQEDTFERAPMRHPSLYHSTYYAKNESFDALVIAIGGRPFGEDTSDQTVARLCATLPPRCKKVCLVSAYGVGDSLDRAGIGIRAMESWYLRDVYAAKRRQEQLVVGLPDDVDVMILRPRALSYANLPPNPVSVSRRELADRILRWVERPAHTA